MEIEFTLENSDLVCTFVPDWNGRNHSSREKVQWRLPNGSNTGVMANLFNDLPIQAASVKPDGTLDDL